jgi:hypothetical protein
MPNRTKCILLVSAMRASPGSTPHALHPPCAQALTAPAQTLFLRLHQRRGPWFRAATLTYAEVPDVAVAVDALAAAGLAFRLAAEDGSAACPSSALEAAEALTRPELAAAAAALRLPGSPSIVTRDALLCALRQAAADSRDGGAAVARVSRMPGAGGRWGLPLLCDV